MKNLFINKAVIARKSANLHSHETCEIILNISGSGVNTVDGTEYPFKEGSVLCIPRGISHQKFSADGFEDIYIQSDEFDFKEVYAFEDDEFSSLRKIMELLYFQYYSDNSAITEITNSLVITAKNIIRKLRSGADVDKYAKQFQCDIIKNFTDPEYSVAGSMAKLPFCRDYSRRLFISAFGMPPKEYLIKMRMEKAAALLKEKYLSVGEIALSCGYYDTSYFSRAFRLYYGSSPANFRKKSFLS